ncbi:hypothetical protein QTO34_000721 [Cnephaeus nilssonii]|uniref:human endogenous retrovirus K endopeptidase n=1 Tax=Cnephaeus nilssonii TaxID=3371016 RepID=A0AA40LUM3_CNENI|nr:hypothetical protein QTO34_000721 [Eptesicus nilssonii]
MGTSLSSHEVFLNGPKESLRMRGLRVSRPSSACPSVAVDIPDDPPQKSFKEKNKKPHPTPSTEVSSIYPSLKDLNKTPFDDKFSPEDQETLMNKLPIITTVRIPGVSLLLLFKSLLIKLTNPHHTTPPPFTILLLYHTTPPPFTILLLYHTTPHLLLSSSFPQAKVSLTRDISSLKEILQQKLRVPTLQSLRKKITYQKKALTLKIKIQTQTMKLQTLKTPTLARVTHLNKNTAALTLNILKILKAAVSNYGPTAPFTIALLESLSDKWLTPNDWLSLARATLSGGDYVLWRTDFVENCRETAQRNNESKNSCSWTRDKLLGRPPYETNEIQAKFSPGLLAQIQGPATTSLAKIRQGAEEPYSDFISRLTDAAERLVGGGETESAFVKHLAYENANPVCQETIRPHPCGNLSDYIKLCSGIGTSHAIGLAIGAALKNFIKDCPSGKQPRALPKTVCPRCRRGLHWANECHSKTDIEAKALPPRQGNSSTGQPPAPNTVPNQGAIRFVPQQILPAQASAPSAAPPQEGQDWTSITPGVVDNDYTGQITILASAPSGPISISKGQRIAQLILLPLNSTNKSNIQQPRLDSAFGSSDIYWVQQITTERPLLTIELDRKIVKGLVDTGADATVISARYWPPSWPCEVSVTHLKGIGKSTNPKQSAKILTWKDTEGNSGKVQPYIVPGLPVNLWRRDILSQLKLIMCSPNEIITQQILNQGFLQGLGKNNPGIKQPLSITPRNDRLGLGNQNFP